MDSCAALLAAMALAGCAALIATPLLSAVAARRGWLLGARASEAARKPERRSVPRVGGLAIALATAMGALAFACLGEAHRWPAMLGGLLRRSPESWGAWGSPASSACAVALAFATGLLDDWLPLGLNPARKLCGQALAGLVFALPWFAACEPRSTAVGCLAALLAVAAQNAINAFDNCDGAAAATGVLGLFWVNPIAAVALAGFLRWNVGSSRRRAGPVAYLGDSGSHALGMLLLAAPTAWPALFVPLLDLARVAWVRRRLGISPFEGDRRHWAHRQQAAGSGGLGLVALCLAVQLPAVIGWMLLLLGLNQLGSDAAPPEPDWTAPIVGSALSALLFALTLVRAPATR